jgi:hypothetical protein
MLEPARNPGLPKEPRLNEGIIGVKALKLFECNLAIQLGIKSEEYLAQTSSRMRADDAIALAGVDRRLLAAG